MDGLVGVAEMDWDRRAFRLSTLGKLRQFTPTLGRSTRQTFGVRGAGVLAGTFRTFGSSPICFCRMHDPSYHLNDQTFDREIRCSRPVKKTYRTGD